MGISVLVSTGPRSQRVTLGRIFRNLHGTFPMTFSLLSLRVAGGRMFICAGRLDAIDVFPGRHLWQTDLPASRPSDDRLVAVEDAIYLAGGKSCFVLDPASGEVTQEISLPDDVAASWSIIRVAGDSLVGACGAWLVCLDRQTGDVLWKSHRDVAIGCLAVGGGKVFCADHVKAKRNEPPPDAAIKALDLRTGKEIWQATGGSVIRYSEAGNLLCTSKSVHRGSDGEKLRSGGIHMVAGDKLVSGNKNQVAILDPQTGEPIGERKQWNPRGCTLLRGGATMLTTRFMGNAAYLDIATGEITSIWNVRAACSNNLFPANGILNVPNLTGGCTCNYMPISQAFVNASVVERLAVGRESAE